MQIQSQEKNGSLDRRSLILLPTSFVLGLFAISLSLKESNQSKTDGQTTEHLSSKANPDGRPKVDIINNLQDEARLPREPESIESLLEYECQHDNNGSRLADLIPKLFENIQEIENQESNP